jgi:hypothetical protein
MKRIIGLFIFSVLIVRCNKEDTTVYKATLVNQTSHTILIEPYKNGVVRQGDIIRLNHNSSFQIAHGAERGLIEVPFFHCEYFEINQQDSIVVVFDTIHKIIHYNYLLPSQKYSKHYLIQSNRNLNNREGSYVFNSEKKSKHNRYNTHTYTFTEQDYLDAK